MKYRTILLFGAPGAGKGTQGRILGTIPGFYHCACGDVFRNLRHDNALGRTFMEYSSQGKLVPDEATVQLWSQSIERNINAGHFQPANDTLLLDGIPRNVRQAEMLREAIDVLALINLGCTDRDSLIQRLQRRALHENRLDDANLDVIRTRLETYERPDQTGARFLRPQTDPQCGWDKDAFSRAPRCSGRHRGYQTRAMKSQFGAFTASELYCPKCKKSQRVRERLLLVLPSGELHEFLCTTCDSSLGNRTISGPAVARAEPIRSAPGQQKRRLLR